MHCLSPRQLLKSTIQPAHCLNSGMPDKTKQCTARLDSCIHHCRLHPQQHTAPAQSSSCAADTSAYSWPPLPPHHHVWCAGMEATVCIRTKKPLYEPPRSATRRKAASTPLPWTRLTRASTEVATGHRGPRNASGTPPSPLSAVGHAAQLAASGNRRHARHQATLQVSKHPTAAATPMQPSIQSPSRPLQPMLLAKAHCMRPPAHRHLTARPRLGLAEPAARHVLEFCAGLAAAPACPPALRPSGSASTFM